MKKMKLFISLALICMSTWISPVQAQDDELLAPEKAFQLSAWIEGDRLIANYQIAPGYYMYRKAFAYEVEGHETIKLDNPEIRKGRIIEDEFFGEMEVYRGQVRISLPVLNHTGSSQEIFRVKATGQGCADIGVCYPPLRQSLVMNSASDAIVTPTAWSAPAQPVSAEAAQLESILNQVSDKLENASGTSQQSSSADALELLESLGADLGLDDEAEILHPDEAFILTANLKDNGNIDTSILLANDIYLYLEKVAISLTNGEGHKIGEIKLPEGKQKEDEFLGPTRVVYQKLDVTIPVSSDADASDAYTLAYRYQGCVEDRICYPPVTKYLQVDQNTGLVLVSNDAGSEIMRTSAGSELSDTDTPLSEQDQFTNFLKDKSLLVIIGLFFLAGLGLTFTPCVFPMIPILSSIIAGQGESVTTLKAFTLSLTYVLAMAITYATVGAIAGYYGNEFNIQIWFQDPVILGTFATIFVLLALSMFGFYELQMPNAIQSRLTAISNSQQGGTLIGVALMGLFSAIIVGPCITAPLVGALFYITQTQDWQLGGLALFALGMGMGVPLLLIGTSAGNLLPRAGAWMDSVKAFFGIVLLGVAIWLLERVLPVSVTMLLIAALMIASAIYMGALDSLEGAASGWRKFFKSIGLMILIYGIAYLIGAAAGSRDLLQPLNGITGAVGTAPGQTEQHLSFRQIKGQQGLQLALNDASARNQTTMFDFYADWCISCKEMERYTFTHPEVLAALKDVSVIQTDVTANDETDIELMSSLGIYGPPAILFFDENGNEIRHRRVVGEMSGEEFATHLRNTF